MLEGRRMRRVEIKRIYDEASRDDGFRVLVDRIWPRGVSRADAAVDYWAKDIAPSTELRKWFGHDPKKWDGFRKRYRETLKEHEKTLRDLIDRYEGQTITLLFAAKDRNHNQAVVLKEVMEAM